jgi:hypothetical protein
VAPDLAPMGVSAIRGRYRVSWASFLTLGVVIGAATGCGRSTEPSVLVATNWPLDERVRIQSEFQQWMMSSRPDPGHAPIKLEWLVLAPCEDMAPLALRRSPPDVLLGARAASLEQFSREERLIAVTATDSVRWCITRRPGIQPAERGDPRRDTLALAWALRQLEPGRWREGYARLVDIAGHGSRIGWHAGVERGNRAAGSLVTLVDSPWPEGAGILSSARDPAPAREFLRFLIETRQADLASSTGVTDHAADPDTEPLVADLLGATLVDAQDELWTAWDALERAGAPEPARTRLTEPPAWPPASVEKYLKREGENAMSLIETLAGELSPRPAVRSWLIRSWLSPPRLVDAALLAEMAHAAEGRLIHEPRFRSWLRAEWTASARQRYRRVAKLANTTQPRSDTR